MTQPVSPATLLLDQAVLNASMALIRAELDPERDEQTVAELHDAYDQAFKARWPNG